jgi:hypothetical protein
MKIHAPENDLSERVHNVLESLRIILLKDYPKRGMNGGFWEQNLEWHDTVNLKQPDGPLRGLLFGSNSSLTCHCVKLDR